MVLLSLIAIAPFEDVNIGKWDAQDIKIFILRYLHKRKQEKENEKGENG